MRVYAINYDSDEPGKNYEAVQKRIEQVKLSGGRVMLSSWLITSDHSATQIRDHVKQAMDSNDKLLVNVATTPGAWKGLGKDWDAWIQKHLGVYV